MLDLLKKETCSSPSPAKGKMTENYVISSDELAVTVMACPSQAQDGKWSRFPGSSSNVQSTARLLAGSGSGSPSSRSHSGTYIPQLQNDTRYCEINYTTSLHVCE